MKHKGEIVMRVFVTGATGFIGSAVVQELINSGHQVTGLARNDAAAKMLISAGAKAHRGDLEDLDSLRRGAIAADGVIHTAFIHDIAHMSLLARCRMVLHGLKHGMAMGFMSNMIKTEERAIEALGSALAGSGRPLVVAAGTIGLKSNHLGTEADDYDPNQIISRRSSEVAALAWVSSGVRASMVRLPPSVHDQNKQGFVSFLIEIARKKGVSAFVGDGNNRWPAVHRLDVAPLFRLALEKGVAGYRYHGVTEEGIPFREIAEIIGRRLQVPVVRKSADHFGFLKPFVSIDSPASSQWTQSQLGWQSTQPGLISDLEEFNWKG